MISWTTNDGRSIPVDNMEANHISNVIAMLRKNNGDANVLKAILLGAEVLQQRADEARRKNNPFHIEMNGDIAQQQIDDAIFHEEFDDDYGQHDDWGDRD